MRYIIKLSYDGSSFNGWQIQPNAPSVQQTLEQSLSTILGLQVSITGAGRTDTSVNAIGYVAHFDLPEAARLTPDQLAYKLNAILPKSIIVHNVEEAGEEFHARFSAKRREYAYFINRKKDPFVEKFSYRCSFPLDIQAMNRAAALMLGTHDFSCFEKLGADNKTSNCTVFRAEWESYTPEHVRMMGYPSEEGDYLVFHIAADRFLRNMVRATVGTLIDVGRGRRSVEEFGRLILKPADAALPKSGPCQRCRAGESVPGNALFLCGVDYESSGV